MFTLDKKDLQRMAISMVGALLLAATSVAGVATGANQGVASARTGTTGSPVLAR